MDLRNKPYSNKFINELSENVQGMFLRCYFDKNYTALKVDGACFELTGYKAEEFISKDIHLMDIIHLEDRKWIHAKREDQMANGLPIVNEYRIIGKQGRTKWVKEIMSFYYDEVVDKTILEGLIQDITPFKINAFMSNAFTSFQNAVNNGSIVSITDKTGKILFVNENFCKISKFTRQELVGKDHRIINSGYHKKEFFGNLWTTISNGQTWRGQMKNKSKDGSFYWVDTVITPVYNDNGEIDQYLSIRNVITEQKESEYALLESEALNSSILKSLQTNTVIIDENGLVLKINDNWSNKLSREEIPSILNVRLGDNYYKTLESGVENSLDYAKKLNEGIRKVHRNEMDIFELEYAHTTNSNTRWYSAFVSKFENDISRVIVSHFDITQRKHQEVILRKNEARLRHAQKIAKIGSFELNVKTGEFILSEENYDIFQIDKESFLPSFDFLLSLIHPEDRVEVDKHHKESLQNKTPFDHVHRLLLPNGTIKYVNQQWEVVYDDNGRPILAAGTTQDITRQKSSDLALEKQRLRYKNVVENISDGLIIDNIEGKVIFANKQFQYMIGIEESDLENFVFVDYVAPEFKQDIIDRHNKRMSGEDVSNTFEYAGTRKDGSRRWFEARVTKIMENGKIVGTQSAIRDITEAKESLDMLKASEAEKTKLLNELTKRYNELMQFNYIVSHNLRAPIANLLGLSEVFELNTIDEEERLKIIGHIRYSILKIDELIQDLNIILAARSDINSKKELVVFEEIILSVKQTLEKQILETNTHIFTNIDEDAKAIFSIKSYVKSIVYNIVNNSIKYRAPGRIPEINIDIKRQEMDYLIKISDNGIGIDLERYGKEIFGLYKRFNFSVEGKGLGLNMTKAQIEALGGNVVIESEVGKGTSFNILLPYEQSN